MLLNGIDPAIEYLIILGSEHCLQLYRMYVDELIMFLCECIVIICD